MARQPEQTRGKKPNKPKAFLRTAGNREVTNSEISSLLRPVIGELDETRLCELTQLIDWRLMETQNRYLSWSEAQKAVVKFKKAAKSASKAISEISQLGENDVSRPLGTSLLNGLDSDFNHSHPYRRLDWASVQAWLDWIGENIEGQFAPYEGGAAPYDEFILNLAKFVEAQGYKVSPAQNGALSQLLQVLEQQYPGLVFPIHHTQSHARRDYLGNVLRRNQI